MHHRNKVAFRHLLFFYFFYDVQEKATQKCLQDLYGCQNADSAPESSSKSFNLCLADRIKKRVPAEIKNAKGMIARLAVEQIDVAMKKALENLASPSEEDFLFFFSLVR
jgi:hypothetical protein